MKKVFATILAVIYLSTSMGATVHLHYCMGKLFSWSLSERDGKSCGKCGMLKTGSGRGCMLSGAGCCKDRQTLIQLDKNQKTAENDYTFSAAGFIAVPVTAATLPGLYAATYIAGYPTTNAPPKPDKVPLFIRNCHFRI